MKARLNFTFFRDSYLPAHDFRTPDYSAARRRYLHDSPAEGKTSFPAVSSCSCRLRGKVVAAYILDPRAADQAERQVEVRNQVAHYVPDPVLAVDREAIAVRAAQQHGLGAQGKRLEDIGASADAAIEQDRYSSRDGFHDAGQGIQRGIAPSNCRPPWLETMTPSTPCSIARCASSACRMPLSRIGRREFCRKNAKSSHVRPGLE